jgi:hydrogenase/urease accessory protein HupE
MRILVVLAALLGSTAAYAHPGHLAEVAGHGHWLGAAAIGAAIAIGLWAGLKGRKSQAEGEEAEADDTAEDPQEA